MAAPFTLFEIGWEVCNKVGGIHTVISTKARTLAGRFGDDYLLVGPWLLAEGSVPLPFDDEPAYHDFCESCRQDGIPVRVGRWRIPGHPLTILVQFSGLYPLKDGILSGLWERHQVDSLFGEWDYVEPMLFGHAAGMVIQKWWREHLQPLRRPAVAQFHEWLTGAGLLYLKDEVPAIGTVFTTHATALGRSVASTGIAPEEGVEGRTAADAATAFGIRAKHSMEGAAAREADVFTTVSAITAAEAEIFHERKPELLPNGIDLEVERQLTAGFSAEEAERGLRRLAGRFLGTVADDAALICTSGRYEFHNKGIDLLLDALGDLNEQPGRPIVLFVLVPAGNTGLRREVQERLADPEAPAAEPLGIFTHNVTDFDTDPVRRRCHELGLRNQLEARVKVIHVPIYLDSEDHFLEMPYEAVIQGMELTCFPSFYEPWGYTPQESLALGVPTVTSDVAGFGQWMRREGKGPADGVLVLSRDGKSYAEAREELAGMLREQLATRPDRKALAERCRQTARTVAWDELIVNYDRAFEGARDKALERVGAAGPEAALPRMTLQVLHPAAEAGPHLMPFEVNVAVPKALRGLEELARNFWWSWNPDALALFEALRPEDWEGCCSPLRVLHSALDAGMAKKAGDPDFQQELQRVLARFEYYQAAEPGVVELEDGSRIDAQHPIAYLCAEFGLHESLPIYSGGLGVLAGDHLKSASDLNLPLVALGLFYDRGYLDQRLTAGGEQVPAGTLLDPRRLPVEKLRGADGAPVEVSLQLPGSRLVLQAWRVRVGRIDLFLLDSNLPANRPEDREITRQLYSGDHEMRLRQEIVLGRGGVRLLAALGIEPAVLHLNEGHAAFAVLERLGHLIHKESLYFEEAREVVRETTAFTTHTPVPAGHDQFDEDLMRRYFSNAPEWLGLTWERFFALGQTQPGQKSFNMSNLAIGFSAARNGVSRLHTEVSQKLFHPLWPRLLTSEVPFKAVTNGVHLATWTDGGLARLLGAGERSVTPQDFADQAAELDSGELWAVRQAAKRTLLETARASLRDTFISRQDSPLLLSRMLDGLDENALYVGFARRFAPYKRAHLLFRDLERLEALVSSKKRPLRVFFAGKAHPQDTAGMELLKEIVQLSRKEPFLGRVFFLEGYDMELAQRLVQGADVWLNNPLRGLEASGTSGMKAAANGVLNLSILDGWWCEGYDGGNGWAIGRGRTYPSQDLQDEFDSTNLLQLLEEEVLPLYFERDEQGIPQGWLEKVRRSLATIPPVFNTDRMVWQYRDQAYAPLARRWFELSQEGFLPAREAAAERRRISAGFQNVKILRVEVAALEGLKAGDLIPVEADVDLANLVAGDVVVELVLTNQMGNGSDLQRAASFELAHGGELEGTVHRYRGSGSVERAGSYAYGIRVRARGEMARQPGGRELVIWA